MYNQWHLIEKATPQEKGQYLVVAKIRMDGKNRRHLFLNEFDGQHFSYDVFAKERGLPVIYAWTEIPEPPPIPQE